MISTLLRISRTSLRRDRVAQTMTYVLPIVFFSIFAGVFGRAGQSSMARVRVAVVDEDRTDPSRALLGALQADSSLRVLTETRARNGVPAHIIDRTRAEALIRSGDLSVAVVLPPGWGATFPRLDGSGMKAEVMADVSDPVASRMIVGMLQRAGARAMRGEGSGEAELSLVPTTVRDLMSHEEPGGRMVSFYAAGIAVMFLLFSCSAAGGLLLDEQETGTLERVLNTNVGMTGLLAGKWLHVTLLGISQIVVMFIWGR